MIGKWDIQSIGKKIGKWIQGETVLAAAALLAVLSIFFVAPDREYLGYIDYRVLGLLFSLMVVMAGLQELGFFKKVAAAVLGRVKSYRELCIVAVALCFFSSMLITNDVALITFVPLTILVMKMAGLEAKMIPVIVLQTVAANLGSMLTPIGNPQNLYLYAVSGMSLGDFLRVMGPLTLVSLVLLAAGCLLQKDQRLDLIEENMTAGNKQENKQENKPENKPENAPAEDAATGSDRWAFRFFVLLFGVSLLSVLRVIPFYIPLTIAVIGTFFIKREVLKKVDHMLLLTFVCFFVFIGNAGRIEVIRNWLEQVIGGRELLVGFLSSQVISNVPACLLLSGFTEDWSALLMGVNIGGLGTLIASLASLISYKFYTKEQPGQKGRYMVTFTWVNLLSAAVLLTVGLLRG